MSDVIRLGRPPTTLTSKFERLYVFIETSPGSVSFELAPWAGHDVVVRNGSGDRVPTATLKVSHAINRETHEEFDGHLYDWEVLPVGADTAVNLWSIVMGGRCIQVRTRRPDPQDDWVLFEGFIQAPELHWSGSAQEHRTSTLHATSTIMAADFELSQFFVGQWRRSLRAEMIRRGYVADEGGPSSGHLECVRVGVPVIFNPGGRANAAHFPLTFGDDVVFVPGDPVDDIGIADATSRPPRPYTVARILRYIQWAAMQPAPVEYPGSPDGQYDVLSVSSPKSIAELQEAGAWTSYGLGWGNLDKLIEPLLALDAPAGAAAGARHRALLQVLPDVAIEGMSTLEALAYVCERAGILFHVEVAAGQVSGGGPGLVGRAKTSVYFTVRGDRTDNAESDDTPSPPGGGGENDIHEGEAIDPSVIRSSATARAIYLYVPTDRVPGTPDSTTAARKFATFNAAEGSLGLDESGTRVGVFVSGSPGTYEGQWQLVPGWKPDEMWDATSVGGRTAMLAAVGNSQWNSRYKLEASSPSNLLQYGKVGRYWALNEHGGYIPLRYKRQIGPWSTDAAWFHYDFSAAAQGNVFDLATRRQRGWSARRRKFLPPRAFLPSSAAEENGVSLGLKLLVSWDSGSTWYFVTANVKFEEHECAVYVGNEDLEAAVNLRSPSDLSFPRAYIGGTLRLAVVADIEGDDAVRGFSQASTHTFQKLQAWDVVSRRDQFTRRMHLRPGQARTPAANALQLFAATDAASCIAPLNRDDSAKAKAEAQRIGAELHLRRHNGQVTIPWLHRDGEDGAPWIGYRIGDEILGVRAITPKYDVPTVGSSETAQPAARVVGINYTYRADPEEQSTTIVIEDHVFHADETMPAVEPERRR